MQINAKLVGIGIIVLSIIMFIVLYTFTKNILVINQTLHKDCPLPEGICPYNRSIPSESAVGFTVTVLMLGSGLYLIATEKGMEKITVEQKGKIKKIVDMLENDDKKVYEAIIASNGFIFQSELVNKLGFSKVKITRILDRLEGKGLIERRRRGMSNAVILKYS